MKGKLKANNIWIFDTFNFLFRVKQTVSKSNSFTTESLILAQDER